MNAPTPSLSGTNNAPVVQFETQLLERSTEIEAWFRWQWQLTPPPFYCSSDLRNAGFKLAPVDTNLFPGGFNNLNPAFNAVCVQALQSAIDRVCPAAKSVALIPENHTRNRFYLENVATLAELMKAAGFRLRIGSLNPEIDEATTLKLEISGRELTLEPVRRQGNRIRVGDLDPCAVLLNNDLSGGVPAVLHDLDQAVTPPAEAGWHERLKSQHFGYYRDVAAEFAKLVAIDPWWIDPLFRNCGQINFKRREGEECLINNVELLLEDIAEKYQQYGIDHEPFVIIKADAGTYGMGVMTAKSADDVREMNRKARTHMSSAKEGRDVTGAIIQEGVYTAETWGPDKHTAEPVVYMIDRFVVGGFYRVNEKRGNQENLNAPGMSFKPLPFDECCNHPDFDRGPDEQTNRFYAYGVVARLALLAAAREI
ncbi:MAG: glutamate--cysteine ligase, partial [Panacagrimonas sp.]